MWKTKIEALSTSDLSPKHQTSEILSGNTDWFPVVETNGSGFPITSPI